MIELYLVNSIFIGILLVLDGWLLLREPSVKQLNKVLILTTSIEFLWVIISILLLIYIELNRYQMLIPVLYITNNIIGWIYGFILSANLDSEEDVNIPKWYIKFELVFGLIFTLASVFMLTVEAFKWIATG